MYINKFGHIAKNPSEYDVAGSAVDLFLAHTNMRVTRLMATVSTQFSSTGASVLTVYLRPTIGSTSGEVAIGTISIPTGAVVGATYYKDVTGVVVKPGQQVAFKITTAASSAGKVYTAFEANEEAELAANMSNMIASA